MTVQRVALLAYRLAGVVGVAVVVVLLEAACWVASDDGSSRGDLIAMGIWVALLGCLLGPVGFALRRLGRPKPRAGRALVAAVLGLLLGAARTYGMAWMMGQLSPPRFADHGQRRRPGARRVRGSATAARLHPAPDRQRGPGRLAPTPSMSPLP